MKKQKKVKRIYLTIEPEFYAILLKSAKSDFMKLTTWITRYLKKSLETKNNNENANPLNRNECN